MIYSKGCEYAIRALTRLAGSGPPGQLFLLRDLIEGSDEPHAFLSKLFQDLVRNNILVSAKGRGGGFGLRRSPEQITLRQIVEVLDGANCHQRCVLGFDTCDEHQSCGHHEVWDPIRKQIEKTLDHTTLADLSKNLSRVKPKVRQGRRR